MILVLFTNGSQKIKRAKGLHKLKNLYIIKKDFQGSRKMNEYKNLYTVGERKQLIAGELVAIRMQHGYTQKQVAEAIGVKTGTYNAYEKMRSEPPAEIIVRLAYFYDVSTDEILQKDNLLKDPQKCQEQMQEFQKAMEELQKRVQSGDEEAIKLQGELIKKGSDFLSNLLTNISEISESTEETDE